MPALLACEYPRKTHAQHCHVSRGAQSGQRASWTVWRIFVVHSTTGVLPDALQELFSTRCTACWAVLFGTSSGGSSRIGCFAARAAASFTSCCTLAKGGNTAGCLAHRPQERVCMYVCVLRFAVGFGQLLGKTRHMQDCKISVKAVELCCVAVLSYAVPCHRTWLCKASGPRTGHEDILYSVSVWRNSHARTVLSVHCFARHHRTCPDCVVTHNSLSCGCPRLASARPCPHWRSLDHAHVMHNGKQSDVVTVTCQTLGSQLTLTMTNNSWLRLVCNVVRRQQLVPAAMPAHIKNSTC